MLQVIDFRTSTDTGEPESAAIDPIANGESVDQVVLRRPVENNRGRNDALRTHLRDRALLQDYENYGAALYGGGVVTPGTGGGGEMTFTLASNLHILPFATPGGGASAPYTTSTRASLSIGTSAVNEIIFTSVQNQFEGASFPVADANKIAIEILGGGSGGVVVSVEGATGEASTIRIVIDETADYIDDVITAVAGHATASSFVTAIAGTGTNGATALCPEFGPTEWGTDYTARFLRGGAPGLAHTITPAFLTSFFSATTDNELGVGDTLAIAYDQAVDTASTGGRFQSTPENSNTEVGTSGGALFNTRYVPASIPNCIPVCKRVDTNTLVFINGAVIVSGTPATLWADSSLLSSAEDGLLDTIAWDRLHANADHNPPTTIRQALDNADKHVDDILDEVEGARSSSIFGAQSSLDDRIETGEAHTRVYVSVSQPAGTDGLYTTLPAAITALNAANGGTIYLRAGTYTLASSQTLSSACRVIGTEEGVIIANNIGVGMSALFDVQAACVFENIQFTEGAAASDLAADINTDEPVQIRNCTLAGGLYSDSASAHLTLEDCIVTGPSSPSSFLYLMDWAAGALVLHRCTVSTNTNPDRVFRVDDTGAKITCHDCEITLADGTGLIAGANTGGDLAFAEFHGCTIAISPYTALADVITDGGTASFWVTLTDTFIRLSGTTNTLLSPIVALRHSASRLTLRSVVFAFLGNDLGHTTHATSPFHLACSAYLHDVHITGVRITDTSGSLAASMFFMNLDPPAAAEIVLDNFAFKTFACDAGTIDLTLIGRGSTQTGTGVLKINNGYFAASGITTGAAALIVVDGTTPLESVCVTNCVLEGGTWGDSVVNVAATHTTLVGNKFIDCDESKSILIGAGSASGVGYVIMTANTVEANNAAGAADVALSISNAERAVLSNNIVDPTGTTATADVLVGSTVTNLAINGNVVRNGYTIGVSGTVAPATVGNTNVTA